MFLIEPTENRTRYQHYTSAPSHFVGGAFLQSWEWGDFLSKNKERVLRVMLLGPKKEVVGRATFAIRKTIPLSPYAYCPFGPELDFNKLSPKNLADLFSVLAFFLKKRGLCFLRFNPPCLNEEFSAPSFLRYSRAKSKQPHQTLSLSLANSADSILAGMKQKTRYNIRLAEKRGVTVRKENGIKAFEAFWRIAKETGERDGFALHGEAYYKNMIKSLGKAGILKLYTAHYKDEIIAANIVLIYKNTATYLHGASSNKQRNLMSPYLLQWQAIKDAKQKGVAYYDFWGFDESVWPGVTRFKKGFGGKVFQYAPTYELPIMPVRHAMLNFSRKILGA